MIFPYIRIGGLIPVLLPLVSTGVAVFEGRRAGGITGLVSGILCDISFNQPAGAFTVLLTISGLVIGVLADTTITRGFVAFVFSSAAVLVICSFVQMFPLMYFGNIPPHQLLPTALWELIYSLIFTFPIWFFVRALGKRAQRVSPSGRPL